MAVVINGTTGIDTIQDGTVSNAKIAADAVTTPKIADTVNLGRRNLVTNGEMQICQRDNSVSGVTSTAYHVCDRWLNVINIGTWTISRQGPANAPNEFSNSLQYDCTTSSSLSAGSELILAQRWEGQDLQHLKFGHSDAQSLNQPTGQN